MPATSEMFLPLSEVSVRLHRPLRSVERDLARALHKLESAGLQLEFTRLVVLAHAARNQNQKESPSSC